MNTDMICPPINPRPNAPRVSQKVHKKVQKRTFSSLFLAYNINQMLHLQGEWRSEHPLPPLSLFQRFQANHFPVPLNATDCGDDAPLSLMARVAL